MPEATCEPEQSRRIVATCTLGIILTDLRLDNHQCLFAMACKRFTAGAGWPDWTKATVAFGYLVVIQVLPPPTTFAVENGWRMYSGRRIPWNLFSPKAARLLCIWHGPCGRCMGTGHFCHCFGIACFWIGLCCQRDSRLCDLNFLQALCGATCRYLFKQQWFQIKLNLIH